jgi:hypothetical protein
MLIQPKEVEKFFPQLVQDVKTASGDWEQVSEVRVELRLPIDFYIDAIHDLPDLLMEIDHGIRVSFDGQNADDKLFKMIREQYRAKADWLKFYLLAKSDLAAELTFTRKAHYKRHAELCRAFYQLIQEVFLLSGDLQDDVGQPELMLLLIERERCENHLRKSGFTDKPELIGKVEQQRRVKKFCDKLWDVKKLSYSADTICNGSPTEILLDQAINLAKDPNNFKFHKHYHDFLRNVKRFYREVKDCPTLHHVFLEGDALKVLGDGCRGKQKKGFNKNN